MLPTLGDDSLRLRPQQETDLAVLATFLAHPSVRHWFGSDTVDDLRPWPEGARSELDGQPFTIEIDGQVAGWLQVSEEPTPDYRHAGLDIMLGPDFQDRGAGPAALKLAARWMVEELGHHRITIDPSVDNPRAIAAYRKVGFRDVGVMRRYGRNADGTWSDALLMDLLADELSQ